MSPGGKSLSMQQVVEGKGEGHIFEKLCREGWQWLVISYEVEDVFPALPAMYERALNCTNSATVVTGELEIACDCPELQLVQRSEQGSATGCSRAAQVCKLSAHHRTLCQAIWWRGQVSFDHIFEGSQQVIWAFLADW